MFSSLGLVSYFSTCLFREMEVRAAEERLLQNNSPTTVDEFEKLVRNSPNSSFVWIKYMDFFKADVEKARSIAERYYRTNCNFYVKSMKNEARSLSSTLSSLHHLSTFWLFLFCSHI